MLRTITLHGGLGNTFGSIPLTLDVDDVRALFSGLKSAFPEFLTELRRYGELAIVTKKDDLIKALSHEDLVWPLDDSLELHLYTSAEGAGLESATAYWLVSTFAVSASTAITVAAIVVNIAIAVVVGAIAQSLAPKPEVNDGGSTEENKSALFDQAVNLEGAGHAIPLVYGRFKVGSVVISAEVTTEKNAIAIGDYTGVETGSTATGNVLSNDIDGSTVTITSYILNAVSHAAGSTTTIGDFSLTLNADGSYSITGGSSETAYAVTYYGTSPTTPSVSATWRIQVSAPREAYEAPGD